MPPLFPNHSRDDALQSRAVLDFTTMWLFGLVSYHEISRWSFCRIIPFHSLFHSPTISLGEDYSRPQITHRASYKVKIPLGRLLLNGKMICWKPRLKNWQKLARKEMNTRPH